MKKWNAEQRLICDLLDNYQVKWGRPVRNTSEDVEVRFGLQLIHISDLVGVHRAEFIFHVIL